MLNICVTFDYELFMGNNYYPEKQVLIDPTEKIGNLLSEMGIQATFFADVCCPIRYRELGYYEFPDLFDRQIQTLIQQNQDVQLHIHSNWIRANSIGEKVDFDRSDFRIHNWAKDGNYEQVQQIIRQGIQYLQERLMPVKTDYRVIAFRAGGYCLQPEKKLIPILYDEGIRIDSSVCRGFSHDGDGMLYDYKKYPGKRNVYLNDIYGLEDNHIAPISNGILEIPVEGFSGVPYRQIASKLNSRISDEAAKGYGMSLEKRINIRPTIVQRIKNSITATNMLTFDFYNDRSMIYMLEHIWRKEKYGKEDAYIAIISHPKGMTDKHIENMKKVIDYISRFDNVAFVSMRQIADSLGM